MAFHNIQVFLFKFNVPLPSHQVTSTRAFVLHVRYYVLVVGFHLFPLCSRQSACFLSLILSSFTFHCLWWAICIHSSRVCIRLSCTPTCATLLAVATGLVSRQLLHLQLPHPGLPHLTVATEALHLATGPRYSGPNGQHTPQVRVAAQCW